MNVLWNWIEGQKREALSQKILLNMNPATNTVLSTLPDSDKEDVESAVLFAKKTFQTWKNTSYEERADYCQKIADEIEKRKEEFALAECRDTGKPFTLALNMDISRAIANFRFFAGAVLHQTKAFHPMHNGFNYTHQKPVGIVGLITPWNLPLYLLSWKTAPALMMGNCIVAKPSELTPTTATLLTEVMEKVGLPAGVFQLVHGFGHKVGQAMVEHPDIRAISFTGGTETGKRVAQTAAPLFKKVSLELGGKNPTILFEDAKIEENIHTIARSAFLNQGQICLCGSRIFVQQSLFEKFKALFVKELQKWKIGDPEDPTTQFGSLISKEHLVKVENYVDSAIKQKATLEWGGQRPSLPKQNQEGFFLRPTLFSNCSPFSQIAQEEVFGPVVTLHPFDTTEEVLKYANSVPFGLSASVWTQDLTRAHQFSQRLETGMVWVNTWLQRDLRVPFGGVKQSGLGREGGEYSLSFFSETQNICVSLPPSDPLL